MNRYLFIHFIFHITDGRKLENPFIKHTHGLEDDNKIDLQLLGKKMSDCLTHEVSQSVVVRIQRFQAES
jgi:hypothetical protein